jgi:hypothetical protein
MSGSASDAAPPAPSSKLTPPITVLRWPLTCLLVALAGVPFLFAPIPPLTDVLGHIGRFAVQTAAPGDPLLRFFHFHWGLTLNLASDLIVQLLHPLGVQSVVWALCAATPMLTVIGIVAIARVMNRRGAYALPWSLLFVYNFPFLWGFLNFALMAACALIAFAAWNALAHWRGWRAALFLVATPTLLVGHGVAGIVAIALIVGHAAAHETLYRPSGWTRSAWRRVAAVWPPLLSGGVMLIVWKLLAASDGGRTQWMLGRKGDAILMMLRDQNALLDVASVVACAVVWGLGQAWGARTRRGAAGATMAVIVLFVATPSMISGSDQIDTRLAPLIPMLAFALQDWSLVAARRRRTILALGFAVLALRFGVTTASFAGYQQRYTRELAALDHVPRGARILTLVQIDCGYSGWRSQRLEHLANLATPLKRAWVNAHWSISGLQLLDVAYRPSPAFYRDPSQLLWPTHCFPPGSSYATRGRHTLVETLPHLPLGKVDYLWVINDRLSANTQDPRLQLVWHDDISAVYATQARPDSSVAALRHY